jgi:hypothetical protein
LFHNATKNGNVTAQIFWLKTRAKWVEARPDEGDRDLNIRITGGLPDSDMNVTHRPALTDDEVKLISHHSNWNTLAPAAPPSVVSKFRENTTDFST